jgi:hypothetical protein
MFVVWLFFVPALVEVTFTENVQPALAISAPPESEMVPEPSVAVMVPPPHVPDRPFGVATISPAGSGSLKAMFDSDALEFGFCTVNEREVVPPTKIVIAPKTLEMEGGVTVAGVTDNDALAVEPVPPLVELTASVVLFAVPVVLVVTFRVAVQLVLLLIVAPLKEMVDAPATGANVAPLQFVVAPAGDPTVMPDGKVSLKLTPVSATGFAAGLPSANVSVVVPPAMIEDAPNAFEIVGGPRTTKIAVA